MIRAIGRCVFLDGSSPLCPKYNLKCFLYNLFRWVARAINFCDHYLINIWSCICLLYLCDWRSFWPSFHNLMLWYPLFSICLLIPFLEDTRKYFCDLTPVFNQYFHDLMPVFNQIDWNWNTCCLPAEQIPLRLDSPPFMGGLLGPRMVRVSGMAKIE